MNRNAQKTNTTLHTTYCIQSAKAVDVSQSVWKAFLS